MNRRTMLDRYKGFWKSLNLGRKKLEITIPEKERREDGLLVWYIPKRVRVSLRRPESRTLRGRATTRGILGWQRKMVRQGLLWDINATFLHDWWSIIRGGGQVPATGDGMETLPPAGGGGLRNGGEMKIKTRSSIPKSTGKGSGGSSSVGAVKIPKKTPSKSSEKAVSPQRNERDGSRQLLNFSTRCSGRKTVGCSIRPARRG